MIMGEPKLLPPSMRSFKRYVVFEVISEHPVVYNDLVNAVWNSMLSFLGELDTSEVKFWLIENLYDTATQQGVIKCKHDFVEKMRTVLSLIQIVGETKVIIKILGVTGTIKSAKNKYLLKKDLTSFTEE